MAQVKPIPDGYPSLTPYLIVADGAGAIAFYERVLGAKLRLPPGVERRVDVVRATGPDGAPPALLVRPDAIAAWTPADGCLEPALDYWF